MSTLSIRFIHAHTGLNNSSVLVLALPLRPPHSQTARNPPALVISGPASYNTTMHGSFNAYPSFPQQPQPLFGNGYNANVDLSAQTAHQITMLQAKLDKKLGSEYISQRPGRWVGQVDLNRGLEAYQPHK